MVIEMKSLIDEYENLIALCVEVKKRNTPEFMVYFISEIDRHKKYWADYKLSEKEEK